MRRLWRWGLRFVVLLLILVGLGTAVCLGPVDRRAYTGRPYEAATRARLEGMARDSNQAARVGDLRAGFGKAKLTPTLGAAAEVPERGEFRAVPLAGYGNRQGRPATGVHDDVWVKAVAFAVGGRTGVVVSADALIIPREVTEAALVRLRTTTGLGRESVYFGATHTHCSLGGWGEGWVAEAFAGGYQPGVRVWMAHQLAEAAVRAVQDLAPAELAHASFQAPDLVRNRLVGDRGAIDPQFGLLEVQKADGKGRAVMGSFAAHATVLSGAFMEFSGDYPGYWQRGMEDRGYTMAMFLAGAVGSHSPKPPEGGLAGAKRMGELLSERAAVALRGVTRTNRIAWSTTTLEVELPELQARITDGIRLRPWLARRLLPVGARSWLQAWRLGDALWLSAPCDYSGELALDLEASARTHGLQAVVTSFNGDYLGYVIPSKYYSMSGYEPRTMSFFGPQLPDYFDDLFKQLTRLAASSSPATIPGQP